MATVVWSCGAGPLPTAKPCDEKPATVPAQSPLPGGIDVTVQRLDGGCGLVLVSAGVPLPPGALKPTQTSQLRVFVGDKEQALYVEPLNGLRGDGSLRAILVQFNYGVEPGAPVSGQLVLGQQRATTDIAKPTGNRTTPAAIVLPTNPDYLVSTEIVGPTKASAATASLSATHAKYESDFRDFADKHWNDEGSRWEDNYYDRALIYYAWWVRTGNPEYWKRATAIAVSYRRDYLEANNYGTSAHWSQIEGVELHYLLTGDDASRYAVGRVGDIFSLPYYTSNLGKLDGEMDNRIQARTLMAFLTAWRIGAPSESGSQWATLLPHALTDILSSEDTSGAYRFSTGQCSHNKPFMVGLLNDALIKYYDYFNADPRIPPAIKKSVDYMWANDWNAPGEAFVYLDGPCPTYDEGQVPAPDLNNVIVTGFAWTFRMTGDAAYRDRADRIFAGAVARAWLAGSKQFNQQYTSSFRYLAYRE